MKMYDIASRLAGFLACETGLEQAKVDRVRFGLEILLGEIIKWVILLIAAAALGVLPGALYAMVGMAVFRMVSGGAHCEDYWRCLAGGLLIFIGAGKVGVYAAPHLSRDAVSYLIAACYLVMTVLVLIWAPGDVPNRRIKTGERGIFRGLSLAFLAVWTCVTVFVIAPYSVPVAVAGLLGMVVQAFSFTPAGYLAIDQFDIALSKIIGERRCPRDAQNA